MVKVIKKLVDIFLVLLIAILALYYVLRITNKIEIFSIVTGSMETQIHSGDYVLIFKGTNYKIGDIVTYQKENYYITHRIVKEDSEYFVTKGDANNAEDEKIHKNEVIGKVIIAGGILNIIIVYKFVIVGVLISLYLAGWIVNDLVQNNKNKKTEEVKK